MCAGAKAQQVMAWGNRPPPTCLISPRPLPTTACHPSSRSATPPFLQWKHTPPPPPP